MNSQCKKWSLSEDLLSMDALIMFKKENKVRARLYFTPYSLRDVSDLIRTAITHSSINEISSRSVSSHCSGSSFITSHTLPPLEKQGVFFFFLRS